MVDRDELKDSEYDGIQEYDNDLPAWWVNLFWITIIWGVLYAAWFHWPGTPTPEKRLEAQMNELAQIKLAHAPKEVSNPVQDEEMLLAFAKDAGHLSSGSAIFAGKCVACHGAQGQGLVGPNLTDSFWIHGGKATEIKGIVMNGVLAKGMLPWKDVLSSDDINNVVAFVLSLQGTNPTGGKGPEGNEFKR